MKGEAIVPMNYNNDNYHYNESYCKVGFYENVFMLK